MSRNLFIGNDSHFDHAIDTVSNALTIGGSTLNGGLIGIQQATAEALSQISGRFISKKTLESPEQLSKIMEEARLVRWEKQKPLREAREALKDSQEATEIAKEVIGIAKQQKEIYEEQKKPRKELEDLGIDPNNIFKGFKE